MTTKTKFVPHGFTKDAERLRKLFGFYTEMTTVRATKKDVKQ